MVRKDLGIIGIAWLIHLVTVETLTLYSLAKELAERPVLCNDTIDDLNSGEYRLEDLIGIIKDSFEIIIANKLSVITS